MKRALSDIEIHVGRRHLLGPRNHVRNGSARWLAARLCCSRTTNPRRSGGRFASIYTMPGVLEAGAR
jgi:hypothetical protein